MIVIPNAVNRFDLNAVWSSWPDASWRGWHKYSGRDSVKYGTKSRFDIPAAALRAIEQMVDAVYLRIGTPGVKGNVFPDYELWGAGLHMIPPGGHLARHLDSAVMESTGWRREYSCVLSANPRWSDKWGGEFVLRDEVVLPEFNQLVLFETTEDSYHEVRKVVGPEPRCTLAVFFWSTDQPEDMTRTSARFFHD